MIQSTYTDILVPGIIDSPLKFHLTMVFYEHSNLCCRPKRLVEWLHESPWATEEALETLADSGILSRVVDANGIQYRLAPGGALRGALAQCAALYADPYRRDEINELIRAAHREQQFQWWIATECSRSTSCVHCGQF